MVGISSASVLVILTLVHVASGFDAESRCLQTRQVAPTLIPPPLCALGTGSVLTSGQHQSLFRPRNSHEKYAALLGKLAPEGLRFVVSIRPQTSKTAAYFFINFFYTRKIYH